MMDYFDDGREDETCGECAYYVDGWCAWRHEHAEGEDAACMGFRLGD